MELGLECINEVEYCILKLLLTQKNLQQFILQYCNEKFFEDSLNRKVFEAAKELYAAEKLVDNVGVYHIIRTNEVNMRLTDILIRTIAYPFAVKRYCKLLFENYLDAVIKEAHTKEDFEQVKLLQQQYETNNDKIKNIGEDVDEFVERYEMRKDNLMITTWDNLDRCIGSFCGGDYIALGGSTGAGKTTIALNIAKNLCMLDKSVLYCSLEMPLEQLQNKFNCLITRLSASKYRSHGFTKEEFASYQKGLKTLNQWNLNIVCDYDLTIDKLRFYAEEQKKAGLDFIIVDYLGLMTEKEKKSLYEKSTALSRKIKLLATELNIPILVLVQLNRSMSDRKDKRPILSDIRESGAIEQDADIVMFAYRDYVFSMDETRKNDLEIVVAKNRHGESNAICNFDFDLTCQLITEKKKFF